MKKAQKVKGGPVAPSPGATPSAPVPNPTPAPVSTFDPNTFYSNPQEFAPQYTADPTQAASHLQELQDAKAYLIANPNTPYADHYLQELDKDIAAQTSVVGNLQATQNAPDVGKATDDFNKAQKDLRKARREVGGNLNAVGNIQRVQRKYEKLKEAKDALVEAETQKGQYDENLNKSRADLISNFHLPGVNVQEGEDKLRDYLYNPQTGAVQSAVARGIGSIHQMAYNLRKGVNQNLALAGLSSSGVRQRQQQNISGDALGQAVGVKQNAENQAAGRLKSYEEQMAEADRKRQDLENSLKTGSADDLYSQSTQDRIAATNRDIQAQRDKALNETRTDINTQQQSDEEANKIWGGVLGAAGTIAGAI